MAVGALNHSQNSTEAFCRCFPVDQCWPSVADWAAFNETIDGKLTIINTWLQNLPAIVDAGATALWTLAEGFFSVAPVFRPNLTAASLYEPLSPTLKALYQSGIPYCESPFRVSIQCSVSLSLDAPALAP